jgi:hypothetical protein
MFSVSEFLGPFPHTGAAELSVLIWGRVTGNFSRLQKLNTLLLIGRLSVGKSKYRPGLKNIERRI